MAGRFEWIGRYTSRSYLYHVVAEMSDDATKRAAEVVAGRARDNLAAANRWIRIVRHEPFTIDVDRGTGKYPVGTWDVSLAGDNPAALEYGHQPSGAFAGTKTKAPSGLYILHRAAGMGAKVTGPRMGREFRVKTGRSRPVGED